MKKITHFSKVRSNRIKYLKLFPLFIRDIDQVNKNKNMIINFIDID